MGFFLATFPVLLLMGDRPLAPILITLYICLSTVSHANVPWTFGPLGRLFVSPAYHRVHHSIDDSKGMNLGIALTIWDVLARRAVFPQPGESLCRTGVNAEQLVTEQTDQTTPHLPLMLTQLLEPFRSA
jgi:sterol desaturase/sphingolipid hydroxylase (fatty acid hydroxylase superfamily)